MIFTPTVKAVAMKSAGRSSPSYRSALPTVLFAAFLSLSVQGAQAQDTLPIADAHIHYSHDSVELTPPSRVIEIMREANLKFALVSSSDDNGTQLLSELAPDLIVPGLRPYRRRGETGTWFTDPAALAYVEKLLATNRYASIGEFHLYGDSADLDIPKRIVELADQHNLILHAHSDADAVERLLAQSPTVKVIWAHSGFDSAEEVAAMLGKHDRLWADLAFRSEVGSGGSLGEDWVKLFTEYPDRMMLGTDTYTPERMYYIPDNAAASRTWLATLPAPLAENIAWKNAFNLIMPVWNKNRTKNKDSAAIDHNNNHKQTSQTHENQTAETATHTTRHTSMVDRQHSCEKPDTQNSITFEQDNLALHLVPPENIEVSQPFPVMVTLCGEQAAAAQVTLDASMPKHGHGMNYQPLHNVVSTGQDSKTIQVNGLVLHMPGDWQWSVKLKTNEGSRNLTHDFVVD